MLAIDKFMKTENIAQSFHYSWEEVTDGNIITMSPNLTKKFATYWVI